MRHREYGWLGMTPNRFGPIGFTLFRPSSRVAGRRAVGPDSVVPIPRPDRRSWCRSRGGPPFAIVRTVKSVVGLSYLIKGSGNLSCHPALPLDEHPGTVVNSDSQLAVRSRRLQVIEPLVVGIGDGAEFVR